MVTPLSLLFVNHEARDLVLDSYQKVYIQEGSYNYSGSRAHHFYFNYATGSFMIRSDNFREIRKFWRDNPIAFTNVLMSIKRLNSTFFPFTMKLRGGPPNPPHTEASWKTQVWMKVGYALEGIRSHYRHYNGVHVHRSRPTLPVTSVTDGSLFQRLIW